MTRPTTITLSFLLVLLVIAGMTIKSQMEDVARPVADSLVKHPELTTDTDRMKGYEAVISEAKQKGWRDSTIHIVSVEGSGYTTAPIGDYTELDTLNFFPEHSEIKP